MLPKLLVKNKKQPKADIDFENEGLDTTNELRATLVERTSKR